MKCLAIDLLSVTAKVRESVMQVASSENIAEDHDKDNSQLNNNFTAVFHTVLKDHNIYIYVCGNEKQKHTCEFVAISLVVNELNNCQFILLAEIQDGYVHSSTFPSFHM